MEILKLTPVFQEYIWGGTRLKEEFGKETNLQTVAESWELSCHENGLSRIEDGAYQGKTLKEYIEENPESLGTHVKAGTFPVLIKLIDAAESLSVQVHPDDDYAYRHNGESGKTELWYIIDSTPDASLIYGFKEAITRAEMEQHIRENTLLSVLSRVPVKKGDVFFIPAGTIHAIGAGCLIAEIQQNSDATYRVYDYGRIGKDGKPRALHIEDALNVTNRVPMPIPKKQGSILSDNPYFRVEEKKVCGENFLATTKESFTSVLCVEGEGRIGERLIRAGDSFFLPAKEGHCPLSGHMTLLVTTAR